MANDTIEVLEVSFGSEEAHHRNLILILNKTKSCKPISQIIDDGMKPNWGTGRCRFINYQYIVIRCRPAARLCLHLEKVMKRQWGSRRDTIITLVVIEIF